MARTQADSAQIKGVDLGGSADDITGTLTVPNGGTGNATNTLNNVLLGNGTGALQAVAPSTAGKVLRSDGTTWAATVLAATDLTGILPEANGGTGASSITGAGIVDTTSVQSISGQKTLSSPKIASGLQDSAGDWMLVFVPAGSGANYIGIFNASAGTHPGFYAGGTDTNINIPINPAGTGRITSGGANVPTVSSTDDFTNKRATLAAGSTTVAPLKFTSGTSLTTAAAGAQEYDGSTFAGTIDTTSGRGLAPVDQMFRLTADGSALGPTIADYYGTNSAFPYVAGGVYEIVWYLMYTKATVNTVTYTITSTTAPVNLNAWYVQNAIAGIGTQAAAITAGITKSTSTAAALPITGSQAATQHIVEVHAIYEAHASSAGNVRLRVTSASGTVTPLRGSFYRVRRLPAGNVGTFVA